MTTRLDVPRRVLKGVYRDLGAKGLGFRGLGGLGVCGLGFAD